MPKKKSPRKQSPKKSPKKREVKPVVKTRTVDVHELVYREIEGREEVRINGRLMPFFHVEAGYQLEANAYEQPLPTLLDAAEAFAKTIPANDCEGR